MNFINSFFPVRYFAFVVAILGFVFSSFYFVATGHWGLAVWVFGGLIVVGVHDLQQTRHAILRNYPIIGHLRFLLEFIRPELRQYFIEGDGDAVPFQDRSDLWFMRVPKVSPTKGPLVRKWMSMPSAMNG